MKIKTHVKKDDEVVVISGNHKGKQGTVTSVNAAKEQVIVEGVRKVKKAINKLPPEVTPEERAELRKALSLQPTKPMRGRWGSFHNPRKRMSTGPLLPSMSSGGASDARPSRCGP